MPPGISQSETEEGRNQKSDAHVALGIPGLLVVDGVDVGDLEEPGVVGLDLRVQALHLGRVHLHPRGGRGGGDARAAAAARAFRLQVQATQTPSPCRERRRKPRQDSGTRVCRSSRTAGWIRPGIAVAGGFSWRGGGGYLAACARGVGEWGGGRGAGRQGRGGGGP